MPITAGLASFTVLAKDRFLELDFFVVGPPLATTETASAVVAVATHDPCSAHGVDGQ